MGALGKLLRTVEGSRIAFWCPGCNESHSVVISPRHWTFNGNAERPTFSPSILVRSGHFIPEKERGGPGCWCTYNAKHPNDQTAFRCSMCHSFVTDGRIQFLGDCSHELAGKTVPLPEFP